MRGRRARAGPARFKLVFCFLVDLYIIKGIQCGIQRFAFFLVRAVAGILEGGAEGVGVVVVGHFSSIVERWGLEFAHAEHGVLGAGRLEVGEARGALRFVCVHIASLQFLERSANVWDLAWARDAVRSMHKLS